jgi:hypothetical protein
VPFDDDLMPGADAGWRVRVLVPERRRLQSAVCVLGLFLTGCSVVGNTSVMRRCQELEPHLTAANAWNDTEGLGEAVEEWIALDCRQVLGREH